MERQAARGRVAVLLEKLRARDPGEPEFHQVVQEVAESVLPYLDRHPDYLDAEILERLTEPDRIITFRVTWEDDSGEIRVNRAWRVQFNNAIGPYKGGLRFREDLTLGVLKLLAFEQVLKNSLTGLPLGGAKGGADFSPRGKSDREVMRFCQALMTELHRHIGEHTDVPAGDIGVGAREIGYLFGQYKRMENRFTGTLTGKDKTFGGSPVRTEATGYGVVCFTREMLARQGEEIRGKRAVVSGSGNVALYCTEKLAELGARVVTASDSDGFVHDPDGIAGEKLAWLKHLKEERRGRIREYAERYPGVEYHAGARPWDVPAQLAFPCATQNELERDDACRLVEHGVVAVAEGANMPCSPDAVKVFQEAGVLFAPGKAANAGGVAVSGLEQSQNSVRIPWTASEVSERLEQIMSDIHARCVEFGDCRGRTVDYVRGANLAGFVKVADAMLAHGIV